LEKEKEENKASFEWNIRIVGEGKGRLKRKREIKGVSLTRRCVQIAVACLIRRGTGPRGRGRPEFKKAMVLKSSGGKGQLPGSILEGLFPEGENPRAAGWDFRGEATGSRMRKGKKELDPPGGSGEQIEEGGREATDDSLGKEGQGGRCRKVEGRIVS